MVNYASTKLIVENFAALDFVGLGAQMIIVDNFTSLDERRAIMGECTNRGWLLVPLDENLGFGQGVNLGVEAALTQGASAVLIVNPDVSMSTEVAGELIRSCGVGLTAVCPRIVGPTGKPGFVGGGLDVETGAVSTSREVAMTAPSSWLSGACIAVNKELWLASGGFDPEYFMYWEDVDFSQRCRRAGAVLEVRSDLTVVHSVGGTQGEGKSALYTYYNCRNRLLFAAKWMDPPKLRRWVRRTPAASYEILRRGDGRRSLLDWAQVSAAVRGSVAGLRLAHAQRSEVAARVNQ